MYEIEGPHWSTSPPTGRRSSDAATARPPLIPVGAEVAFLRRGPPVSEPCAREACPPRRGLGLAPLPRLARADRPARLE